MQIEISQSQQFKCSTVYVAKDAIIFSYNCFTTIMQQFLVKIFNLYTSNCQQNRILTKQNCNK